MNLDSFCIGLNYGLRRIKVPVYALSIIVAMTAGTVSVSWLAGHLIFSFFSVFTSKIISSGLLILLGCLLFLEAIINLYFPARREVYEIKKIKIKPLKIIIEIARELSSGDMDQSGTIDYKEAVYIGFALSIDGLTIGLSLSALGFRLVNFVVLSAALNYILLFTGQIAGKFAGVMIPVKKLKVATRLIIVLLGVSRLI